MTLYVEEREAAESVARSLVVRHQERLPTEDTRRVVHRWLGHSILGQVKSSLALGVGVDKKMTWDLGSICSLVPGLGSWVIFCPALSRTQGEIDKKSSCGT